MILSDGTIGDLIESGYIGVDPYDPALLQPASLDMRLGNEFRIMRPSRLTHIDPANLHPELMDTLHVPDDETFVLHPGEFALGHTLETFSFPDDIVGIVNGRSSLGRIGLLVHATAGWVDAGFRDATLVLEFGNIAALPIVLRPGMGIAQMVFARMDKPAARPYGHPELNSKYQGQQGAQQSMYQNNGVPVHAGGTEPVAR